VRRLENSYVQFPIGVFRKKRQLALSKRQLAFQLALQNAKYLTHIVFSAGPLRRLGPMASRPRFTQALGSRHPAARAVSLTRDTQKAWPLSRRQHSVTSLRHPSHASHKHLDHATATSNHTVSIMVYQIWYTQSPARPLRDLCSRNPRSPLCLAKEACALALLR
jgi:hypothetical protein